jgi:hypothetical protein
MRGDIRVVRYSFLESLHSYTASSIHCSQESKIAEGAYQLEPELAQRLAIQFKARHSNALDFQEQVCYHRWLSRWVNQLCCNKVALGGFPSTRTEALVRFNHERHAC